MAFRLFLLGATGSLGSHVLHKALAAGHEVSVLVRNASRLPPETRDHLSIHTGDLAEPLPQEILRGHDALINCAGHVADGQTFVDLLDRVIVGLETLPSVQRPVCWFLAGAALLDIRASGTRGVDLPEVNATYWPHRVNLERLDRSDLDWRLLCPGPMVKGPPLGLDRLCISLDRLPVEVPAFSHALDNSHALGEFLSLVPQLTVPFSDSAALMLANLTPGNSMSRHRVGLARRGEEGA